MSNLFTSQISEYSLKFPQDPTAILNWFLWFIAIVYFSIRSRDRDLKINRKIIVWFAILSLSVLGLTPFFSISLNLDVLDSNNTSLMLFTALPWLVAGGMIGVAPSVLLAGMSGLLTVYLETHDVFTPLIFMTCALFFSSCVRQRYRPFIFRCLRSPIIAAFVSVLMLLPFQFVDLLFGNTGELSERIVQVIHDLPGAVLSFGGMVLIGGVICSVFRMVAGKAWGDQGALIPGPGERSVKVRMIGIIIPVLLLLSTILLISSWVVAENSARRDSIKQLTSTSDIVTKSLSVFVDTGTNLLTSFAGDDRLVTQRPAMILQILSQKNSLFPFFDLLTVSDLSGEVIAVYPADTVDHFPKAFIEAYSPQTISNNGSLLGSSTPSEDGNSVHYSYFLVGLSDSSGGISRLLWGRTAFESNIFLTPVINALSLLEENNGTGRIVGNKGTIIYQETFQEGIQHYSDVTYSTASFFEGLSPDGQAIMQYHQPVEDTGWSVVTTLPMVIMQASAWQSMTPLLLLGMGMMFMVFLITLMVLSPVDKQLKQIETAIDQAANGKGDPNILAGRYTGVMGSLKKSVQELLVSHESKLSDQNLFIALSERIAGQLPLKESLQILLVAALEHGVSSARIVISDGLGKTDLVTPHKQLGLGEKTQAMAPLDDEILRLTRSQGALNLRDLQIGELLNMRNRMPYPAVLVALPLVWQGSMVGAFWVAYHDKGYPKQEDIEFFNALSKSAASTIVKIRSVDESRGTQNPLANILNTIVDPVLITDTYGRIAFLNDSAQSILIGDTNKVIGSMVSTHVKNENFLTLIQDAEQSGQSTEIRLSNGKIYHVVANPAQIENQQMGVLTLFKDISHYKDQDALKNEFVLTASHELRSPLTSIHGYAKILRLTGNLNDQQDSYVRNIVKNVEDMNSLVQNLLSLGRLESNLSLEIKPITAHELIDKVVGGLHAQLKQKSIRFERSMPETKIVVEADVDLLKLALSNLVDNAIKFTKMGGYVTVHASQKEDNVIFKIQDTGIGIAPLDQKYIFTKFHSVSSQDKGVQYGSGLGLAIVKSVADRHHGRVWVESKLGSGSTFFLEIPIKQS